MASMETKILQSEPTAAKAVGNTIEIDGLTKRYGDNVVLDHLTFNIPENSIVGFLGPNGAGKTTTIKLLLGLATPTEGTARIFGLDGREDGLAVRSRIGYLAQDPLFYPYMTARETLDFAARFFFSGTRAGIRQRIGETLELVGLSDKADRPIKGFSGGERQRLGIAQAQVNHPDLLILDEPAAALDPVGRRDVLEIMEQLKNRTTIFYSTHILDDVQRVSSHVAILDRGRLVANAPTTDLLKGDTTVFCMRLRGDATSIARTLSVRPWVSDFAVVVENGLTTVNVTVTDETTAESELPRMVLAHSDTTLIDFGKKTSNLEDVFLGLVERHEN